MKLLLDQGLPRGACELLVGHGLDVIHAVDAGLSASSDEAILDWAATHDRVVVTLDADFHAILARRAAVGPSVIRLRVEGLRADALGELLMRVIPLCEADLTSGAVATVDDFGALPRVRRLPL